MSGYGNVLLVFFTRVSACRFWGSSVVESLANLAAISFPTIPLWLWTQSILIVKPAEVRLEYKRHTLFIRGFFFQLTFWIACSTLRLSVIITKVLLLVEKIQ